MKYHNRDKTQFGESLNLVLLLSGLTFLTFPSQTEARSMKSFNHSYQGLHSSKQQARAAWTYSARKSANNRCRMLGRTFRLHSFTGRITRHVVGVSTTPAARRKGAGRLLKHQIYGRVLYGCRGNKPR